MKALLLALFCAPLLAASEDLTAYFIDVEGGQATLFITPSGESVLVDTGWAGFNGRDADRIVVLENGQLVETGRHEDLLGASGTYARLVSAQAVS